MAMKRKQDQPMHYASGYTLDLYCDHFNPGHPLGASPYQFYGQTFAECAKQARDKGWVIHRKTRTATCPLCNPRRNTA